MAGKENSYKAPALEKGLDILEYLSYKRSSLSQTEIASGTKKSMNEIYRMLVCLEERGYLIREKTSGKYRLSLKLYNLAHRHSLVDEIRKVAQHPMQELSYTTKQSCHLGVIYHDQLMVIYQSKSPDPISLSVEEGSLFPLLLTASGLTLLSIMNEKERPSLLKRIKEFQEYSPKERKKLLKTFEEIRTKGYYSEKSRLANGITDVVAPIGDSSTSVTAALAVPILTTQLEKQISLTEIIDATRHTADLISKDLGLK